MDKQDINVVGGTTIEIIEEKQNYVYYNTHQKSGKGTVKQYRLWEGVHLSLMDLYVKDIDYTDVQINNSSNFICINHCDVGIFETQFKNGQYAHLNEGDSSIDIPGEYNKNNHCFPLSRYRGIILILDLEKASSELINVLDEDYILELESIKNRIDKNNCFVLYKN